MKIKTLLVFPEFVNNRGGVHYNNLAARKRKFRKLLSDLFFNENGGESFHKYYTNDKTLEADRETILKNLLDGETIQMLTVDGEANFEAFSNKGKFAG